MAKIYNVLLRNHIEPKIGKILRKNPNGFRRNQSTIAIKFLKVYVHKTKIFDSIHRGKMEQILLAYSLPPKNVTTIMMIYRSTKVKVCTPDGDTDYFDIVAGVLFIICLDYMLRV